MSIYLSINIEQTSGKIRVKYNLCEMTEVR